MRGGPLTTTGQPAAIAAAVSPPATEKASGKLEAPNTATGPSATRRWRRFARGSGSWSASGVASVTCAHSPRRSTSANRWSWPVVRPRSPARRARGSPLSAIAHSIRASPIA